MNELLINAKSLPIREYNGQRVVTFKDIDTVHERKDGTAKRNFYTNKERFVEGVDYFKVCEYEIRTSKLVDISPKTHSDTLLLSESGYLMLAKSFTDDLAWKVQRELVNNYFRGKTPEPEQLTLETSEYHYFPKTFKGKPVITIADFEYFSGINAEMARRFVKRYCKLGAEYYLLECGALAAFKLENPEMGRQCSALIVLTRSSVDKLVKYYNCVAEIPMIEGKKADIEPVRTPEPQKVDTDECIVALNVLRYLKCHCNEWRQKDIIRGNTGMAKNYDKKISAIDVVMESIGMYIAAGY